MGFYAHYVLPRLIDLSMRNKEAARLRAEWIPHARGEVLEIGIGSGLNLPFYSPEVRRVYGVDPSVELQRMARKRVAARRLPVEFLSQSAEEPLPLPNESVDTEHGRSPDPSVVAWQDRLTPLWKTFTGGCHLNRKVDELITAAGFQIAELKTCYLSGPRPMSYIYQGFAQPR